MNRFSLLSATNLIVELDKISKDELLEILKKEENIAFIMSKGLSVVQYILDTRELEELSSNFLFYGFFIQKNEPTDIIHYILKQHYWKKYWNKTIYSIQQFNTNYLQDYQSNIVKTERISIRNFLKIIS